MRLTTLLSMSLLAVPPLSQALTLDFGNGPAVPVICSDTADGLGNVVSCGDWDYLSQGHGDVAGVVDVTYSAPANPGASMRWWSNGYNSLYGVAWADNSDGDSHARIELKAVQPGVGVTLLGFDVGAYLNTTRTTTLTISAIGGGAPLYSFAGSVGNAGSNLPTHFAPNVSSPGGLWIEFRNSAYNVGIDNIEYTVGAVPEPAAYALMGLGLAVIGIAARRRR